MEAIITAAYQSSSTEPYQDMWLCDESAAMSFFRLLYCCEGDEAAPILK